MPRPSERFHVRVEQHVEKWQAVTFGDSEVRSGNVPLYRGRYDRECRNGAGRCGSVRIGNALFCSVNPLLRVPYTPPVFFKGIPKVGWDPRLPCYPVSRMSPSLPTRVPREQPPPAAS